MGKIRPTYIKRVSKELIEKHGDKFTADFENNKLIVNEYTDVTSKHLRNRIAGYATCYRRRKVDY